VKRWRRYAEDREQMLDEPDNAAHHGAIVLKTGMPVRVGEHNIGSAAGPMLIGSMEERPRYG